MRAVFSADGNILTCHGRLLLSIKRIYGVARNCPVSDCLESRGLYDISCIHTAVTTESGYGSEGVLLQLYDTMLRSRPFTKIAGLNTPPKRSSYQITSKF
jgi:hypothetical protein